MEDQVCRVCGCTEYNCETCIEKTGRPCYWIEDDLCSACVDENVLLNIEKGGFYLKIKKDEFGFSSTFYGPTIVWGGNLFGVETYQQAVNSEIQKINSTIKNLDKANNGSRKFLEYVLKNLLKKNQTKIF